jgi:hypothetical protein
LIQALVVYKVHLELQPHYLEQQIVVVEEQVDVPQHRLVVEEQVVVLGL